MVPVIKIQAFKRILQWQLKQHTKYNWQENWRTEWQLCHCPERNGVRDTEHGMRRSVTCHMKRIKRVVERTYCKNTPDSLPEVVK